MSVAGQLSDWIDPATQLNARQAFADRSGTPLDLVELEVTATASGRRRALQSSGGVNLRFSLVTANALMAQTITDDVENNLGSAAAMGAVVFYR